MSEAVCKKKKKTLKQSEDGMPHTFKGKKTVIDQVLDSPGQDPWSKPSVDSLKN